MPRGKAKNPEVDGRRTRARRPAMPVQVVATMTNGKRLTINGYRAEEERGFLKIITGMAEAHWLALSSVAHVEVLGVMQHIAVDARTPVKVAGDMYGMTSVEQIEPQEYVSPLMRQRKAREDSIPKARPLPPEKTKGPSSLIENPDGSTEQVAAMMIAPGA